MLDPMPNHDVAASADFPVPHEVAEVPVLRRQQASTSLLTQNEKVRDAKILIIDDEELVIRVVRRFLVSDGYQNFTTCLLYTSPSPRD